MAEVQGDEAEHTQEEDREEVAAVERPDDEAPDDGSDDEEGIPRTGDLVVDTVTTIARALVAHPDEVRVESVPSDRGPRYRLTVHPEDLGRVIGRGGHIASAIRQLARAAAARAGIHIVLEIGE
jgi:predicted RNA-binding protein YlqC (UPF0109 family)